MGPGVWSMLTVVEAERLPDTVWVDSTSTLPVTTEPTKLLPVAVVTAVVSLELVSTFSVCDEKISPVWT